MKRITGFIIMLALARIADCQLAATLVDHPGPSPVPGASLYSHQDDASELSKFALSINPLGFLQFGPMVNAEFGLTGNVILNTHVRVPPLGLVSHIINYHDDGLDKYIGIAVGGGAIYFFGDRNNKPYAGALLEYERSKLLFGDGDQWEWDKTINSIVFAMNGGYRFRFEGGFFINTGAYLGAAVSPYKWDYTDPSYGEYDNTSRTGTDITPFGMVEVTAGIEF